MKTTLFNNDCFRIGHPWSLFRPFKVDKLSSFDRLHLEQSLRSHLKIALLILFYLTITNIVLLKTGVRS